jgi:hypothetical protein
MIFIHRTMKVEILNYMPSFSFQYELLSSLCLSLLVHNV